MDNINSTSPQNKIAIVILNWNGRTYLDKFLPSVVKYSADAMIYVVDNASTDDSVMFVRNNFPQVNLLQNSNNEGFCRGYNLALQKINAEYYVLLNNDVEVTKDWLTPIVSLMESDYKIAVCQPKIKSFQNKEYFEYAGASGGFLDKYGYPFCRGRIFDHIEKDQAQYDDMIKITWASGAAFFVRSSVYHELGGLDEDFFAHMEEIDFCWRSWSAGYKVICCPRSTVYHLGAGTLAKSNPQKTFLNFRNGLYLLHKNLPTNQLFLVIPLRLILDGLAGLRLFFQGKFKDTMAIIRAHFAYYGAIHAFNIKRKKSQNTQINVLKSYSIVYRYFIRKNYFFEKN